jgi:beta propeller repeat protein
MAGRHRTRPLWILVVAWLAAAAATHTSKAEGTGAPAPLEISEQGVVLAAQEAAPGELIVKLRPSVEPGDVPALAAALAASPGGGAQQLFVGLPAYSALLSRYPARSMRVSAESLEQGADRLGRLEDVYRVRLDAGIDTAALARDLASSPDVVYVEGNLVVHTALVPNDPFYASSGSWGQPYADMWALKKIRPEVAWDRTRGAGIVVAVSDTGVDYTHAELAGRVFVNPGEDRNGNGLVDGTPIDCHAVPTPPPSGDFNCVDDDGNGYADDIRGWDALEEDGDPTDPHGHGTHVAGTIAARGNNGAGIVGVAFEARILPVRFLDRGGSGTLADGAESLVYAAIAGADVVNMSWGGFGSSQLLHDTVAAVHDLGLVLVAAAGNSALDVEGFIPASYSDVIAVAALDHLDAPADFSNFGEGISVSAPGGDSANPEDPQASYNNVLSLKASGNPTLGSPLLTVAGTYMRLRGTSMAAPHVAGVAALVLSLHPTVTNDLVRVVLEGSADDLGTPGFDVDTGHGRVDATAALSLSDQAVTRAELIAEVSAEAVAAPGSPIDVAARVENAGPIAANGVRIRLYDGDPASGGVLLREWTASVTQGAPFETDTTVTLGTLGGRELFLVADALSQVPETSEVNNVASSTVNVLAFQYVERVIASDAGLSPPAGGVVHQQAPAVSGNRIVWTDDRHSISAPEIYMFDLSTGTSTRVTNSASRKSSPSISGTRIVWLDDRNGPANVFLRDLALGSEISITADARSRSKVRIDGTKIVWSVTENNESDVYLYDLATGGPATPIAAGPGSQSDPEIDGNRVVWSDYDGADSDIHAFTLPSGPESPISDGPAYDILADVNGDRFAWTELDLSDIGQSGVRLLDLHVPPYLSLIRTGSGDWDPAISGTDMAWISGFAARRVQVMDLATRAMTRLTPGPNAVGPQADNDRIVWEESRRFVGFTADPDIFLAERNAFPAAPTSVVASRNDAHSIRVRWTASAAPDIAGYRVYRRASTLAAFELVGTTGAGASSYLDGGLATGTRYYYRVTAIDQAGGESAFSNESSAVPNPPNGCRDCEITNP